MADLEATIDDIRAGGDAAKDIAVAVHRIDVSKLSEASAAMPGCEAAELFKQVEDKLRQQLDDTGSGYDRFGEAMHNAADLYESNEKAARDAIHTAGSPAGGPKPK